MKTFFLFLISAIISNCTPSSRSQKQVKSTNTEQALHAPDHSSKISDEDAPSDTSDKPKTIDPSDVTGSIVSTTKLAPSDIISDLNILFPQLAFKKENGDYFQVIRCAASYDIVTLQGESIKNSKKTFSLEDLKWAWSQAVNDSRNCKIVSQFITTEVYLDMPAPSGNFYYVASPCVNATNSSTGQNACSYKLSFTAPVLNYQNNFIEKLRDKSTELALAMATLYSDLDTVRILAKKFEARLSLCEEYYAFTETQKALKRGFIMLVLSGVGAAAGAVAVPLLPAAIGAGIGGAAGGAMMMGMFAQMLGSSVLSNLLNLNPASNSCLYGENIAAQSSPGHEQQRARVSARDYETKFHVVETMNKLLDYVRSADEAHPQGGIIAQDVARMQKIMADMNALDQKVISVNSLIAQGNSFAQSNVDALSALMSGGSTTTGQ